MIIDKDTKYIDTILNANDIPTEIVGGITYDKDGAIILKHTNMHVQVGRNGYGTYVIVIARMEDGSYAMSEVKRPEQLMATVMKHKQHFGIIIDEHKVFVGNLVKA